MPSPGAVVGNPSAAASRVAPLPSRRDDRHEHVSRLDKNRRNLPGFFPPTPMADASAALPRRLPGPPAPDPAPEEEPGGVTVSGHGNSARKWLPLASCLPGLRFGNLVLGWSARWLGKRPEGPKGGREGGAGKRSQFSHM